MNFESIYEIKKQKAVRLNKLVLLTLHTERCHANLINLQNQLADSCDLVVKQRHTRQLFTSTLF